MKKLSPLSSRGFGALEGLLIFVIVAIIGGAGFYVYKQSKNSGTDKPLNDTVQPAEESSQADQPSARKYLNIKEWHVRLDVTDTEEDVRYAADPDDPSALNIYSQAVAKKYDGCKSGGFILARLNGDDDYLGTDMTVAQASTNVSTKENVKKISTHYFVKIKHSGTYCIDESQSAANQTISKAEKDARKSIEALFASLEEY